MIKIFIHHHLIISSFARQIFTRPNCVARSRNAYHCDSHSRNSVALSPPYICPSFFLLIPSTSRRLVFVRPIVSTCVIKILNNARGIYLVPKLCCVYHCAGFRESGAKKLAYFDIIYLLLFFKVSDIKETKLK